MDIKRYFAPTAREALRRLKEELGGEAIVLSNRSVEGGVEITAVLASELPEAASTEWERGGGGAPRAAGAGGGGGRPPPPRAGGGGGGRERTRGGGGGPPRRGGGRGGPPPPRSYNSACRA